MKKFDLVVWAAAAACIVSVVALVANLASTPIGSEGEPIGNFFSGIYPYLIPITMAAWIVALLLMVISMIRKRRTMVGGEAGRPPNILTWIVLLAILVLVLILARSGPLILPEIPENPILPDVPTDQPSDNIIPMVTESLSRLPLILTLGFIVILLMMYLRGKPAPSPLSAGETKPNVQAVESAIDSIQDASDLRGAILQTYRQMCLMVQGRVQGERGMTPRELAVEVIKRFSWPEKPVRRLTGIFEIARYSDHPLREEDRVAAIDSLEEIREHQGGLSGGSAS